MKKLFSLLSLMALVFGLASCVGGEAVSLSSHKLTTPQLVNHEGNSTVALVNYDEENFNDDASDIQPYCSAVWVDQTHILTAHHCVKAEQEAAQEKQDRREKNRPECKGLAAFFKFCDPDASHSHKIIWLRGLPIHYVQWKETSNVAAEPSAWHLGKVVGWDEAKDLALIEAVGDAIPSHQIAELAPVTPAIGDTIHVCGHPHGYYWTFLEGTVAGYRQEIKFSNIKETGPYMQGQVPIYFGNSGGGAFDDYGRLVGISDILPRLPAEGLFVHLDSIRSFLQDQNLLDKPVVAVPFKKVIGVAPPEEAPKEEPKGDGTTILIIP